MNNTDRLAEIRGTLSLETPDLVFIFNRLDEARAEIERLREEANLGLATTGELLAELTARSEIHGWASYRTVDIDGIAPAQTKGTGEGT